MLQANPSFGFAIVAQAEMFPIGVTKENLKRIQISGRFRFFICLLLKKCYNKIMKEYVLNYYPHFKCVAGKCKHSCCAGWEINIDSESLQNYKCENSSFAEKLKSGINFKKSKFKCDKTKRCAFLNQNGLCDLIINLGENSLCQVCRDHPRFRSFLEDRTETGLGFSCEEATRIILSFKDKIEPTLISDDGIDTQLDFIKNSVLEFRKKIVDVIQDGTVSINGRIEKLLKMCNVNLNDICFKKIIKTFLSLERLDKKWSKRLKNLRKHSLTKITNDNLSLYCEKFLVNSLYRHLLGAEDTMWVRARTVACIFSWLIIKSIIENESHSKDDFECVVDVIRSYSAEIEYSEKNLEKLFKFAYKFIKI